MVGVAEVDGHVLVGDSQQVEPSDEVVDVAERTRL